MHIYQENTWNQTLIYLTIHILWVARWLSESVPSSQFIGILLTPKCTAQELLGLNTKVIYKS